MQYIAISEVAICNITNRHIVSALSHTYVGRPEQHYEIYIITVPVHYISHTLLYTVYYTLYCDHRCCDIHAYYGQFEKERTNVIQSL